MFKKPIPIHKKPESTRFHEMIRKFGDSPLTEMAKHEFFKAIVSGNLKEVEIIHHSLRNPNAKGKRGKTALMAAAEKGHMDIIIFLVDKGADIRAKDDMGCNATVYAIRNGHLETVNYFLSKGVDPKGKTDSGIPYTTIAESNNHNEIAELLKKAASE